MMMNVLKERRGGAGAVFLLAWAMVAWTGKVGALEPAEIYDRAREASVEVLVEGRLAGSGWFASSGGRVFTAGHVVEKAPEGSVTVRTRGRGERAVRVVATDAAHDLALLEVSDGDGLEWAYLEISEELPAPGDDVYLFGSAYFRHEVMIRGSVARKEPTYEFLSGPRQYIRCMHISAPSPLGTSGGCWLDGEGRVVGLQSAFLSKDGIGMGIAFSSEPGAIRELLGTGKTRESATLGCGLEESVSQPKAFLARFPDGLRGLVPVLQVKGGAADVAGLNGDLMITHVDGVEAPLRDGFLDAVRAKRPGDTMTLTVVKPTASAPEKVVVTLGKM